MSVYLTLQDRSEIGDVLAAYAFAVDLRAWPDLGMVFAGDAVVEYSGRPAVTGLAAITAFLRSTAARTTATQHLIHTWRAVASEPDAAEAITHVTAHHVALGAPVPAPTSSTYSVTGTYLDRLVRTTSGWRIVHRRLQLITMTGDPDILSAH